jgi:hypothetical protein
MWSDHTDMIKGLTGTAKANPKGDYNDPNRPHPRPRPPLAPFEFELQFSLVATVLEAANTLVVLCR